MIAWRICKAKWAATAMSGEAAAKFPGRWNSAGHPVVYLGESRSLAALEVLVHVEDLALLNATSWVTIKADFDDSLIIVPPRIPKNWRAISAPASTKALGDKWIVERRSAVLRVPSVVTEGEYNFVLNPRHTDFSKINFGSAEAFEFDKRIGRL